MTAFERLHPWCLIRLLPNARHSCVGRFRRRNDAVEHWRVLQRLVPHARYCVAYDPPCKNGSALASAKSN